MKAVSTSYNCFGYSLALAGSFSSCREKFCLHDFPNEKIERMKNEFFVVLLSSFDDLTFNESTSFVPFD